MRFDFGKYSGNYVMLCKTYDEAVDFCGVMHDSNRTWRSGDTYLEVHNYSHEHGTYYYFNEGLRDPAKIKPDAEYKILKWSDFMSGEFGKKDIKSGMMVENREGNLFIVFEHCLDDNQLILVRKEGWYYLDEVQEDLLTTHRAYKELDIMKVWDRPSSHTYNLTLNTAYRKLLFERKEITEVSLDEIAKKFGVSVESLRIKD